MVSIDSLYVLFCYVYKQGELYINYQLNALITIYS